MSDPGPGARLRYVFFPLASAGIVVALVLGIHEVHDRPPLKVSNARINRDGLLATVQINVTNHSDAPRCPTIQISARNRSGLDIDKLRGAPVEGDGRIVPGQTVGFKVEFTDLTPKDYERLDKFVGFVETDTAC